tara:strand:+ start:415 stop:603 length:189 start_codon:yes stop_codon:yes gene_type:complete
MQGSFLAVFNYARAPSKDSALVLDETANKRNGNRLNKQRRQNETRASNAEANDKQGRSIWIG